MACHLFAVVTVFAKARAMFALLCEYGVEYLSAYVEGTKVDCKDGTDAPSVGAARYQACV